MNAVLGLSVTPSAVGLVLVDGRDAEATTVDRENFEVGGGPTAALQTSERAAEAVLRTEALAAGRGQRVHSIGVTWSDDADAEASLLLKSLSESGFDNIVAVRRSEATDALARGIAEMMGYATTAVCVVEPEQLIALVVSTDEGAVQTAVNHSVVTEEDLVGWLSSVFTRADWEPEALVLVGSAEDLDGLLPVLEEALAVPVFAPAEAQLALARGAALACAPSAEFAGWSVPAGAPAPAPRRRFPRGGPVALLAAGMVTFVVSVSAAVAVALAPDRTLPPPRPAAESVPQTPAAAPVRPAPAPVATPPEAPAEPGSEGQAEPAPEPVTDAPIVAPVDPVPEPAPVLDAALPDPASAEGVPAEPPAPDPALGVPGVAPELAVPPVPEERPGILQRIRDRLSGLRNDDPVPPPPPVVPPPPPVLP